MLDLVAGGTFRSFSGIPADRAKAKLSYIPVEFVCDDIQVIVGFDDATRINFRKRTTVGGPSRAGTRIGGQPANRGKN